MRDQCKDEIDQVNRYTRIAAFLALMAVIFSVAGACMQHSPGASTPDPTATSTVFPSPTSEPTPSPTLAPSPAPTSVPQAVEEVVQLITEQVSGLRGLAVMEETPTFFISSEQMAENVRQNIEEEYTREEADIEAEMLALLDFIEPGTDLKEVFADLYAGSVVGYYDTDTGEMFVLNDGDEPDPAAKYTLAHEIVHALQDQTFDLDAFLPEDEENDDLARAKVALVEGDAVLASTEYTRSFLTRSEIRQIYSSGGGGSDLSQIPRALIEFLTFPYREGAAFVAAVHAGGGWDSVDSAYTSPPASTEHIMHPDKYLAGERPVTVTLPDLAPALGGGWEMLEEGVLGEFTISLYLENQLPRIRAANAADFWGGDAYALLRNAELDESALVSLSVWDSDEDAQDFFDAVVSYYEAPRSGSGERSVSGEGVGRWDSEDRSVYVSIEGDEVLLIISGSGTVVEVLVGEFPGFWSGVGDTL